MQLKIDVADNSNVNARHLETKGLHPNLQGISSCLNMNFSGVIKRLWESQGCSEISSFCTAESEYPSMPISTAERQVSKPIENTEIEKNSKTISSPEAL